MNLTNIKAMISQYKDHLESKENYEQLFLYEIQKNYKDNWGLMKKPLEDMIDSSIQSQLTRRLWRGKNFEPKEMMMAFAKMNPDFVSQMFRDLHNQSKAIDGRIDRFMFYCDELLRDFKNKNAAKVDNNHFHDHWMLSIYLALEYPADYAIYDKVLFHKMLTYVKAKNISEAPDTERYFKVTKLILGFMQKEEGLIEIHQKRLNPDIHYTGLSGMMVYEMAEHFFSNPK